MLEYLARFTRWADGTNLGHLAKKIQLREAFLSPTAQQFFSLHDSDFDADDPEFPDFVTKIKDECATDDPDPVVEPMEILGQRQSLTESPVKYYQRILYDMAPHRPLIDDAVIVKSLRQNCTNAVRRFLLPHNPTDLAALLNLFQQYTT